MNQVLLVGRLCKEPEVVTTEKDRKRSVITLAVNRPYKNSDGLYEADFIRCVLWNNVALNTFSYCHTGDVLGIKGRLQTRSYEAEHEEKKYLMEVIAEKITFISSNKSALKTVTEES
ncbi:MAG: single-stranded DNA-binding protein [Bacilli bacterium]|nr:single-stranded DNA-binding protein [Bacilli bacterium]